MRVVDAINKSLDSFLSADPNAHLIGEDIVDPYGGAFKVSKGLSTAYPQQVMSTPISEAAISGFATGMAMKGKPVCLEIMFGDFMTLCTDQLINHMSKLPWVYNDQIEVPVVLRTPMGGKRGYGATHSQSLEKHYCGVPGLTVLAVSQYSDIEAIYAGAFAKRTPHIIIENKLSYARQYVPAHLAPHDDADIVLITYGGSTEICVKAAEYLKNTEELDVNIVEVTQLSPFDHKAVAENIGNCNNVLVVEEGTVGWGFASEVAHALIGRSDLKFQSVSSPDHPIPSTKDWETTLLPDSNKVIDRAMAMIGGGA